MMIQDDSNYMPGPGGMAAMVWQQLIDRRAVRASKKKRNKMQIPL
jgi:hypothetical protein